MRTVLIRLAEMLISSALLSTLSIAIFPFCFSDGTDRNFGVLLLFSFILFICYNIRSLRRCYFELHNARRYYLFNLLSYMIFILITLAVFSFAGEHIYAFLFNIFKIARFSGLNWSALKATMLSHTVMVAVILLAPAGMNWIFDFDQV